MAEPLTPEDLKAIKARQADLRKAKDVIKRAKAAGIDVGESEDQAVELETRLTGIRNAFFPGQ